MKENEIKRRNQGVVKASAKKRVDVADVRGAELVGEHVLARYASAVKEALGGASLMH